MTVCSQSHCGRVILWQRCYLHHQHRNATCLLVNRWMDWTLKRIHQRIQNVFPLISWNSLKFVSLGFFFYTYTGILNDVMDRDIWLDIEALITQYFWDGIKITFGCWVHLAQLEHVIRVPKKHIMNTHIHATFSWLRFMRVEENRLVVGWCRCTNHKERIPSLLQNSLYLERFPRDKVCHVSCSSCLPIIAVAAVHFLSVNPFYSCPKSLYLV